MRWVIALFVALLSIPVAQVAADAWNERPGPQFSVSRPTPAAVPISPSRGTSTTGCTIPWRHGSPAGHPRPAEMARPGAQVEAPDLLNFQANGRPEMDDPSNSGSGRDRRWIPAAIRRSGS